MGKDFMTELVGWRKHGHNNEARITNPLLYRHADAEIPNPDSFCSELTPEQNTIIKDHVQQEKKLMPIVI